MIRDLFRRILRPDARSAVGLLLVVALLVLAVAGPVHMGGSGHAGNACSVCDAVLVAAGAAVGAPPPALHVPQVIEGAAPVAAAPVVRFEAALVHAPRGPPDRA